MIECPMCGSDDVDLGLDSDWECLDCGFQFEDEDAYLAKPVPADPARR